MQIKELIEKAHRNAVEKGFYECSECGGTGEVCCIKCDHNKPTDCTREKNCGEYIGSNCDGCFGSGKVDRNIGELLMLVVSELGEALEAHRKSNHADLVTYNNCLNADDMFEEDKKEYIKIQFESIIKDTFEDELADVFIRLFDICGYLKIEPVDFPHGVTLSENVGESLLEITHLVCNFQENNNHSWRNESMFEILHYIQCLCRDLNIDIKKHIELKMDYNATREYKHGKKY